MCWKKKIMSIRNHEQARKNLPIPNLHDVMLSIVPREEKDDEIVNDSCFDLRVTKKKEKIISGHHERAIKDVKKIKEKMKNLRRKQETTCMIDRCALIC